MSSALTLAKPDLLAGQLIDVAASHQGSSPHSSLPFSHTALIGANQVQQKVEAIQRQILALSAELRDPIATATESPSVVIPLTPITRFHTQEILKSLDKMAANAVASVTASIKLTQTNESPENLEATKQLQQKLSKLLSDFTKTNQSIVLQKPFSDCTTGELRNRSGTIDVLIDEKEKALVTDKKAIEALRVKVKLELELLDKVISEDQANELSEAATTPESTKRLAYTLLTSPVAITQSQQNTKALAKARVEAREALTKEWKTIELISKELDIQLNLLSSALVTNKLLVSLKKIEKVNTPPQLESAIDYQSGFKLAFKQILENNRLEIAKIEKLIAENVADEATVKTAKKMKTDLENANQTLHYSWNKVCLAIEEKRNELELTLVVREIQASLTEAIDIYTLIPKALMSLRDLNNDEKSIKNEADHLDALKSHKDAFDKVSICFQDSEKGPGYTSTVVRVRNELRSLQLKAQTLSQEEFDELGFSYDEKTKASVKTELGEVRRQHYQNIQKAINLLSATMTNLLPSAIKSAMAELDYVNYTLQNYSRTAEDFRKAYPGVSYYNPFIRKPDYSNVTPESPLLTSPL